MNKCFAILLSLMAPVRALTGMDLSCGLLQGLMQGQYEKSGDDFAFPYSAVTLGSGFSAKVGNAYSLSLKLHTDMPSNIEFHNKANDLLLGHSVQAAIGLTVDGQDASVFMGPLYKITSLRLGGGDSQEYHSFDGVGSLASLYYPLTDHLGVRIDAQYTLNQKLSVLDHSKQKMGVLHTGSTQIGVALSSGAVIEA